MYKNPQEKLGIEILVGQVFNFLQEKGELTYPELLLHTRAKSEEVKEALRLLKERKKIECEVVDLKERKMEVYRPVKSFFERFAY